MRTAAEDICAQMSVRDQGERETARLDRYCDHAAASWGYGESMKKNFC